MDSRGSRPSGGTEAELRLTEQPRYRIAEEPSLRPEKYVRAAHFYATSIIKAVLQQT